MEFSQSMFSFKCLEIFLTLRNMLASRKSVQPSVHFIPKQNLLFNNLHVNTPSKIQFTPAPNSQNSTHMHACYRLGPNRASEFARAQAFRVNNAAAAFPFMTLTRWQKLAVLREGLIGASRYIKHARSLARGEIILSYSIFR